MADANEDLLHTASSTQQPPENPDSDDDETEDMAPNFLNLTLTSTPRAARPQTSGQPSGAIPKRGMKDFEANPTLLQSRTLAASRQAMHDALSHTRVHNPHGAGSRGGTVVGTYDAESGETFVRRAHARGKMFATVGAAKRVCLEGGIVREGFSLLPEEALWALESGRLDVRYPVVEGENVAEDSAESRSLPGKQDDPLAEEKDDDERDEEEPEEEKDLGMAMSLQGAYAAFLGEEVLRGGKLTIDRYLVYAALRRAGYVVTRAEGWDGKRKIIPEETQDQLSMTTTSNAKSTTIWSWLFGFIFQQNDDQDSYARQRLGPLVPPGLYRNYNDIYRQLHLIPSYTSDDSSQPKSIDDAQIPDPFKTTFYVYKPSANYRKSAPGPPDFRICVISARDTPLPTLIQLSGLMEEQPLEITRQKSKPEQDKAKSQTKKKKAAGEAKPQENTTPAASESSAAKKDQSSQAPDPQFTPNTGNVGHMYSRLKRGRKNAILAVVDDGLVSYLRLSDSCFGLEKLYQRHGGAQHAGSGAKGGGGGGQGGKGSGGKGKNKTKGGK